MSILLPELHSCPLIRRYNGGAPILTKDSMPFPGGLIDEGDGTVKIYYGASDTVECLATAAIDDLVKLCL